MAHDLAGAQLLPSLKATQSSFLSDENSPPALTLDSPSNPALSFDDPGEDNHHLVEVDSSQNSKTAVNATEPEIHDGWNYDSEPSKLWIYSKPAVNSTALAPKSTIYSAELPSRDRILSMSADRCKNEPATENSIHKFDPSDANIHGDISSPYSDSLDSDIASVSSDLSIDEETDLDLECSAYLGLRDSSTYIGSERARMTSRSVKLTKCTNPREGHGTSNASFTEENYGSTQDSYPSKRRRFVNRDGESKKGANDNNDDDDDGCGDGNRIARSDLKERITTSLVRGLACPFYKHDSRSYGTQASVRYRSCQGPGWKDIKCVKDHIFRKHLAPIHCECCYATFAEESGKLQHLLTRPACEPKPLQATSMEGVTQEHKERIKREPRRYRTDEGKWKKIYQILFPRDELIPSPYYDQVSETSGSRNMPERHLIMGVEYPNSIANGNGSLEPWDSEVLLTDSSIPLAMGERFSSHDQLPQQARANRSRAPEYLNNLITTHVSPFGHQYHRETIQGQANFGITSWPVEQDNGPNTHYHEQAIGHLTGFGDPSHTTNRASRLFGEISPPQTISRLGDSGRPALNTSGVHSNSSLHMTMQYQQYLPPFSNFIDDHANQSSEYQLLNPDLSNWESSQQHH